MSGARGGVAGASAGAPGAGHSAGNTAGGAGLPASGGGTTGGAGAGTLPAGAAGEGGNPEPTCEELAAIAKNELDDVVRAHSSCTTDSDCKNAIGLGDCYTYCAAPVQSSSVDLVLEAGNRACEPYYEHDCPLGHLCPSPPPAVCHDGVCAFDL